MSYKYDASDVSGIVKEADYEAILERMERKTTPNGKNKLSVMWRIRNDVEQPYGNKCLFKDIWPEKDNPDVFNRRTINQLLGTQQIQDGTEFESINDIIKFLENAPMIIHVTVEFDEWRGEDVNSVAYFKKTKIVPQQVIQEQEEEEPVVVQEPVKPKQGKPAPAPANEGVVIGDDDLPF